MGLKIWLITWALLSFALSLKSKSIVMSVGGGLIGSLLIVVIVFALQGKLLTGRNTFTGRNSQEVSGSEYASKTPAANKPATRTVSRLAQLTARFSNAWSRISLVVRRDSGFSTANFRSVAKTINPWRNPRIYK